MSHFHFALSPSYGQGGFFLTFFLLGEGGGGRGVVEALIISVQKWRDRGASRLSLMSRLKK